jgi:hypothetical protein
MSNGYQPVKCSDCGREYICTPGDDYYNATTATDGVCLSCLLAANGLDPQTTPVIGDGLDPRG